MSVELKVAVPVEPELNFKTRFLPRRSIGITVALLAFIMGSLSYAWFIGAGRYITTDDAYIDADVHSVNSRMAGFVKEVPAAENEHVSKGQLLALFDDTDVNVELGFKKAKFEKAQSDMRRATTLKNAHAISDADFELATANLTANAADYKGSQLKLKYTRIVAPISGVIGKRNVQPGQFIQPGQNLFALVPDNSLWVRANYKETQLENISPGLPVEISVDAYPKIKWLGRVLSVSPLSGAKLSLLPAENASGNFTKIVQRIPVRIKIERPLVSGAPELTAGMSVTTSVVTKKKN